MATTTPAYSPAWQPGIFNNKVVFCTGGSGAICSGMVRAMVALGANACIVGRHEEKSKSVAAEIASVRVGSLVLGLGDIDVRDSQKMQTAVDACVSQLGGIDFVIAGAAGNFLATVENLSVNAFKSVVDIDLIGSFITAKVTLPHLVASALLWRDANCSPGGRIIFVTSTNYRNARIAQAHVCAAKAGVNALSDCISMEYGPKGVTSNVIAPGPIAATEGMKRLLRQDEETAMRGVPLQRFGSVKDIADATLFLFGDTGSFINGAYLDVDGGAWRIAGGVTFAAGVKYPDVLDSPLLGKPGAKQQPSTLKL